MVGLNPLRAVMADLSAAPTDSRSSVCPWVHSLSTVRTSSNETPVASALFERGIATIGAWVTTPVLSVIHPLAGDVSATTHPSPFAIAASGIFGSLRLFVTSLGAARSLTSLASIGSHSWLSLANWLPQAHGVSDIIL
jgi:hypothetical protein